MSEKRDHSHTIEAIIHTSDSIKELDVEVNPGYFLLHGFRQLLRDRDEEIPDQPAYEFLPYRNVGETVIRIKATQTWNVDDVISEGGWMDLVLGIDDEEGYGILADCDDVVDGEIASGFMSEDFRSADFERLLADATKLTGKFN